MHDSSTVASTEGPPIVQKVSSSAPSSCMTANGIVTPLGAAFISASANYPKSCLEDGYQGAADIDPYEAHFDEMDAIPVPGDFGPASAAVPVSTCPAGHCTFRDGFW